jgi:hypothetical protein
VEQAIALSFFDGSEIVEYEDEAAQDGEVTLDPYL